MKKLLIFLGVVILALIVVGIARKTTVAIKGNILEKENKQHIDYTSPTTPPPCGSGLAAQDLAGVCRRKPNPTPGALEAVGELKPSEMKVQSKSASKELKSTF